MDTKIELNEFITKTLVDVATGVTNANKQIMEASGRKDKYFCGNPARYCSRTSAEQGVISLPRGITNGNEMS